MIEFEAFPKIPRLKRDIVITEKIDGTNACVVIQPWPFQRPASRWEPPAATVVRSDGPVRVVSDEPHPDVCTDLLGFVMLAKIPRPSHLNPDGTSRFKPATPCDRRYVDDDGTVQTCDLPEGHL